MYHSPKKKRKNTNDFPTTPSCKIVMIESAKELNRRFHNTKLALSYVLPLPSSLFAFVLPFLHRVLHINKAPLKTLYLYVCFLYFSGLYIFYFYTSCKMLNKQESDLLMALNRLVFILYHSF